MQRRRGWWWRRALCLLPLLLAGCLPADNEADAGGAAAQAGVSAEPAQVRVTATQDLGTRTLFDAVVSVETGDTAMDALQAIATVETAYGGAFVRSIDGIGSTEATQKGDWLYYVNGFMARTGAADYVLYDGDFVHWDFRGPGVSPGTSATLGCFPQAFVYGYGGESAPAVVAYETPFEQEAATIAALLESAGAANVVLAELSRLTQEQRESSHVVVIAGPDAEPVRELYRIRTRLGLFTSLEGAVLRTYTGSGDEAGVYHSGAGVLQAMQSPWNPSGIGACETVVLLVSGTDEEGVRAAAGALVGAGGAMMTWCGAIVEDAASMPSPVPAP